MSIENKISPLQQRVIDELKVSPDAPLTEIAKKLGTSPSWVGKVHAFMLSGKEYMPVYRKPAPSEETKIEAICPACGKRHKVVWRNKKPKYTPRIYCETHNYFRGRSEEGMSGDW